MEFTSLYQYGFIPRQKFHRLLQWPLFTVDTSNPWAKSFIVSPGGVFTAVGSSTDILDIAKREKTVRCDLRNVLVMPGIHDGHMHLLFSGLALLSDDSLGMDATLQNVAQKPKKDAVHASMRMRIGIGFS
jgi:predicted amidohydrolase YtcJ